MRKGKKSAMTSEMALRLNDVGFAWDVSQVKRRRENLDKNASDNDDDDNDNNEEDDEDYDMTLRNASSRPTTETAVRRANDDSSVEDDGHLANQGVATS